MIFITLLLFHYALTLRLVDYACSKEDCEAARQPSRTGMLLCVDGGNVVEISRCGQVAPEKPAALCSMESEWCNFRPQLFCSQNNTCFIDSLPCESCINTRLNNYTSFSCYGFPFGVKSISCQEASKFILSPSECEFDKTKFNAYRNRIYPAECKRGPNFSNVASKCKSFIIVLIRWSISLFK